MARSTMQKKYADAKKKYEAELEKLGAEYQKVLAGEIAKLIPEGWYVVWHQSDEQYNDEDYYFGVEQQALCSVMMPRKGKLLKEAVETTYKVVKRQDYYSRREVEEKVVDKYGTEAEYEWHLDEDCKKKRPKTRESAYEESAGVINLNEDYDGDTGAQFDVTEEQLEELRDTLQGIEDEDYQRAFGEQATVRIYSDGTVDVD
jgi:hypothetical protein